MNMNKFRHLLEIWVRFPLGITIRFSDLSLEVNDFLRKAPFGA